MAPSLTTLPGRGLQRRRPVSAAEHSLPKVVHSPVSNGNRNTGGSGSVVGRRVSLRRPSDSHAAARWVFRVWKRCEILGRKSRESPTGFRVTIMRPAARRGAARHNRCSVRSQKSAYLILIHLTSAHFSPPQPTSAYFSTV
ncbi:hypothetical protein E2C01_006161 [Portunus trituberculatus]|uniref:Uncharacterized protein n=1 Tax=Portunus trituberculatus TaxID=210409 RepID=A0A5B7CYJ4_PORTR|nr:hypothetical protein [Portunus trituberculatus]